MAMCRTAGFARVEHRATLPSGAGISCYRKWEPVSEPEAAVPELLAAGHATNFGINFDTRRDEYVSAVFRVPEGGVTTDGVTTDGVTTDGVTLDKLKPQAGEFGVRAISVSKLYSGAWQANFKLPPGLDAGWHEVTVRLDGAPASNAKRIAVDLPVDTSVMQITGMSDGTTWKPRALDLSKGNVLALWVTGLPENADRANLRVLLGGERLQVIFAEAGQVNARVPKETPSGRFKVEIEIGGVRSAPLALEVFGVVDSREKVDECHQPANGLQGRHIATSPSE